ncbi:hypothetical protein Cgig2_004190 [Carnegiea gigantea]|uniref:alpha-1,2-Mannosidase n=1 Tax=Carnegiea gigantea TaxID=171969 RepID=A0A9Q1KSN9_9CARY|nr:hypothetical protein Cgig2_004190 [Carnegiea gigantea]
MLSKDLRTWGLTILVISTTLVNISLSNPDFYLAHKKMVMKEKVRHILCPYFFLSGSIMHMTTTSNMRSRFVFITRTRAVVLLHSPNTIVNPHDELKPLTKTFTNSLSELGNLNLEHLPQDYNGSALTLIESLSSLLIMGNITEFERGVLWLSDNLSFDVDARVNLFECNIRVLGGLVSAHMLAIDSRNRFTQGTYKNQLLLLAEDLGRRFLPAFNTPTELPYAWINLKYGVMENETTETSTSGCGSLILEMGALSRLTGNRQYEAAALRALRKLWSMRSSLNLLGTTLDVVTGEWIEYSSGIGAGVDSFYEYLVKAYVLFGNEEYWRMFHAAYVAVQKYFRYGPWYHEADMRTGHATYWQLTSLQAFWPGLQVLVGDIAAANSSHREFFKVWQIFGVLPERYLLDRQMLHPTEKYYPLRPELAESTFYLYQATKGGLLIRSLMISILWFSCELHTTQLYTLESAFQLVEFLGTCDFLGVVEIIGTKLPVIEPDHIMLRLSILLCKSCFMHTDPWYLEVGKSMARALNTYAKVKGGFASVRDVTTMELEDHQHSFFLAETCKYLYLLFDDSFLVGRNYIFTTEGHPLPVLGAWHDRLPGTYTSANLTLLRRASQVRPVSAMAQKICPATTRSTYKPEIQKLESACHVPDTRNDHRCSSDEECGVDATTCRWRTCSMAGYCGLWSFA